jgi:hypothetical protein
MVVDGFMAGATCVMCNLGVHYKEGRVACDGCDLPTDCCLCEPSPTPPPPPSSQTGFGSGVVGIFPPAGLDPEPDADRDPAPRPPRRRRPLRPIRKEPKRAKTAARRPLVAAPKPAKEPGVTRAAADAKAGGRRAAKIGKADTIDKADIAKQGGKATPPSRAPRAVKAAKGAKGAKKTGRARRTGGT